MNTPEQLSRQAVDEFKAIYRNEFGQTLTDEEIREIAFRLLRFFDVLRHPVGNELPQQSATLS